VNRVALVLAGVGGFLAAALVGLVAVLTGEAHRSGMELDSLRSQVVLLQTAVTAAPGHDGRGHGRPNVLTSFNPDINLPRLEESAFVDPMASVIGDVQLGREVYVAPFASIRGDEGQPISVGDETNIQDGVVIHALETFQGGVAVPNRTVEVDGKPYAVFIGRRVSLAHQSQVHGPARVDDGVFIGMQALVFKASVGPGSVLEPGAKVVGVNVAGGRYVPAGMVVTDQATADRLPVITADYPFRTLNDAVVHVNTSFARGYAGAAESAKAAAVALTPPR
jgi:carbonic anhydrase/acetyltransferase-like protein (isoleucine patch superfamily)